MGVGENVIGSESESMRASANGCDFAYISGPVFMTGFMGSGKSTVARLLSKRLNRELVDMDLRIQKLAGMSVREIFDRYGEAHFRTRETELLRELCGRDDIVVSCGGGVVVKDENTRLMRDSGLVIFLEAQVKTMFERVKDDRKRPLVPQERDEDDRRFDTVRLEEFQKLYRQRQDRYYDSCDFRIDTEGKSPKAITEEILIKIKEIRR